MVQDHRLSNREQEVVNLLLEGKSNKLIAASLGISESTVEFHLKRIYAKFHVGSRMELVLKLGRSTGAGKGESPELRQSTVAEDGETAENRDRLNSRNWVVSFMEAVSMIGKERKMESVLKSDAPSDGSPMTFFEAIRTCLTKYADFNGRASRAEFWWFMLFCVLVSLALLYISQNVSNIFSVAVALPILAAGARRLHDTGRSGWWQLFLLAPVGGVFLLIILWIMPSENAISA